VSRTRILLPLTALPYCLVRQALFLLLGIAVLAGCGGNDGKRLTKQEYARKADAICAEGKRQTGALPNPTNLDDLASSADKTVDILDNALDELRKLRPPQSEQQLADQWLSETEKLKDGLAEIRDRAKENDRTAIFEIARQAQDRNVRVNELATALGMKECSTD
jgi:hypothetical protein